MKIIIGSDHAGYDLKERIKKYLDRKKISYEDCGTNSKESVDYPIYAKKVANLVVKNKKLGILICGSGTGMVIAANKVKGARAAIAYDNYSAKMARFDNNANILTLRGRFVTYEKQLKIVKTFLETKFSGKARHKKRIGMLK